MSERKWTRGSFSIAKAEGIRPQKGFTYRALGLHMGIVRTEEHPAGWLLTHLASGHGIFWLAGALREVLPIATAVAEMADWSFMGIEGWRNRDPDLPKKIADIVARNPNRVIFSPTITGQSHEAAQIIARAIEE